MKLLLTLGHNSSAILVDDYNTVLCGYEEERLSKVKADSAFPVLSINKILEFFPAARDLVDVIYISHWFWTYELVANKYYNPKYLEVNFKKAKIVTTDYYNTHHDLHAKSVWNYCESHTGLTVVADGFGNHGECLSLYTDGKLLFRSYDVQNSLGLMYQYATEYLGMKPHQDEYKLLGYEQQALHTERLDYLIKNCANTVYQGLTKPNSFIKRESEMLPLLAETKSKWFNIFANVDGGSKDRPTIAHFVQSVLELVMLKIIKLNGMGIKDIKLSGGVFYNVKLNGLIAEYADVLEVTPLAGDQGAALGFLTSYSMPIDLGIGIRELDTELTCSVSNFKNITNVFRGYMEFGPRALCNTSTLAIPTMDNVKIINTLNKRDSVMPMAPVVLNDIASQFFPDSKKCKKCKHHMVVAFKFSGDEFYAKKIEGALLYDKFTNTYSGRIQVYNQYDEVHELLEEVGGVLINTSLNAHGQPILYNELDYELMLKIQGTIDGI